MRTEILGLSSKNEIITSIEAREMIMRSNNSASVNLTIVFNLGLIFKPADNISIGGILKSRPKFAIAQTVEDLDDSSSFSNVINFKIPSTYGVGISYRPNDFLTLGLDVVLNQYSDLTDGFVLTDATQAVQSREFQADDAIEIHLSGEYVHL